MIVIIFIILFQIRKSKIYYVYFNNEHNKPTVCNFILSENTAVLLESAQ